MPFGIFPVEKEIRIGEGAAIVMIFLLNVY